MMSKKQCLLDTAEQNSCIEVARARTKPVQAHAKQNHRTEMEIEHIMPTLAVELLAVVNYCGREREFSQEYDPQ